MNNVLLLQDIRFITVIDVELHIMKIIQVFLSSFSLLLALKFKFVFKCQLVFKLLQYFVFSFLQHYLIDPSLLSKRRETMLEKLKGKVMCIKKKNVAISF